MPKSKQKTFKQLVKEFDSYNPNFNDLIPYLTGELKADLEDFTGNLVGKFNSIQTLWTLSQPPKPKSRSRVWKSTNGYIYLVAWSNASLLRILGVKWFDWLKSSPQSPLRVTGVYRNLKEFKGKKYKSYHLHQNPLNSFKFGYKYIDRLEAQFLDELRSIVANIEEGFARPTTSSYLDFLGYSQGSLKEAKGDVQRGKQDGLLKSIPGSKLSDLGIDLKDWHEALKKTVISKPFNKGSYRKLEESRGITEFKFNYPAVDNLDPSKLTYEQFIELINKTDWHLRKLVESLEEKLNSERKGYKIEQSRIKGKIRGN